MASVSLNHIYKVYAGGVTAVSDFCLDIEDKEFMQKLFDALYAELPEQKPKKNRL